jgi:Immunity protein 40
MISELYGQFCKDHGKSLGEVGVNAYAFAKPDALELITLVESSHVPILGGDVYEIVDGRFSLTYDNWYCQKEDFPSEEEYVKSSAAKARDYVTDYADPVDGTVLYRIVFPDE